MIFAHAILFRTAIFSKNASHSPSTGGSQSLRRRKSAIADISLVETFFLTKAGASK